MKKVFKYKEMKGAEIRPLKQKLWEQNGKKCPVLGKEVPLDKMALDHAHKRNDEEYSEDKGVIREALDFRVNAVLGKLENSLKRTGLSYEPDFDMGTFLRNAADYFERGGYIDDEGFHYIHPSEIPKPKKISRRNYNKLKKEYSLRYTGKRKFPAYPKLGKLSKPLKKLFEEYEIEPFN